MTEPAGTARAIVRAIAARETTPDQVLEAALEAIADLDPDLRAWSVIDVEGARKAAAARTDELARGAPPGPLAGVPVGIKEEFDVAGLPSAMRGPAAAPATEDAACVARLRKAGAIVVGKTAMPLAESPVLTRNPWHLDHTPGGTSSGSGAAVAARMVPLAIAEQTAGSTLRPAAFCGVAGFKPSYGRISRFGCHPFTWSRDHVGLIALDVADIALALTVLAAPDPRDPTALHAQPLDPRWDLNASKPPRLGIVRDLLPGRISDAMTEALERAAERFRAAGASVVDVSLPEGFELAWPVADLLDAERAAFAAESDVSRDTVTRYRLAGLVPAAYYVQAERIRTWLRIQLQVVLTGFDALLLPAALGPAPLGLESTGDSAPLVPWSLLGLPALTINAGLSPEGLPLGVQFVGAAFADHELLRVGAWCERVLGRLPAPPRHATGALR